MIKKAALVLCGIFLCSSLSFAYHGKSDDRSMHYNERKEHRNEMRKEKSEYFKELEKLITKYNKASDKKKDSVKDEIKALVSKETDKELAAKKEMIARMQERMAQIESDKKSYVDNRVDDILSPEGQDRIKKMSSRDNKDRDRGDQPRRMDGDKPHHR